MASCSDVVAYAYNAAIHCLDCAAERFDSRVLADGRDEEVNPVFRDQLDEEGEEYCDTCGEVIDE